MIIAILTNGVCCATTTSKANTKKGCQWLSSNQPIKDFNGTNNEDCDVITIKLENDQLIK